MFQEKQNSKRRVNLRLNIEKALRKAAKAAPSPSTRSSSRLQFKKSPYQASPVCTKLRFPKKSKRFLLPTQSAALKPSTNPKSSTDTTPKLRTFQKQNKLFVKKDTQPDNGVESIMLSPVAQKAPRRMLSNSGDQSLIDMLKNL